MQEARMLGYRVAKYAKSKNVSHAELSLIIGCTEARFAAFASGRAFLSFVQLSLIAERLEVDVGTLLSGEEEDYHQFMESCTGKFTDNQNREMILDIIDEYIDLLDAIA